MTLTELIARLSYKPNVRMVADETDSEDLWLMLSCNVPCAVKRDGSTVTVELHYRMYRKIWEMMKDPCRLVWVRRCLDEAERHEVREWLALDGARVFDPHALDDKVLSKGI